MKQTAVEWLEKELNEKGKLTAVDFFQAKEMEKQQLNIARIDGINLANKGYGTKGSDEYPEIEGTMAICNDIISSQTEISDEEIQKAAESQATFAPSFVRGVEWYREQLKQRQ